MSFKLPKNKIGCFVFWPLAVWIFIGGIQNLSLMSKLDETGVSTVAEVIAQKKNSKGTNIPVITFNIDDTSHRFATSKLARCSQGYLRSNKQGGCARTHPEIGAKIEIRVNPDNPKEFLRLSGGSTTEKSWTFVFVMIFLFVLPWIFSSYYESNQAD